MHYNAFISYKHAENDIKVAKAVQHSLEHFHIPRKLQKKYGLKCIQRVFRDKDELSITSDLSDEISAALYDADYLIVICSPASKQSVWVQREINFFLRNHTKKQILTVIAEGDPQEVIPEILLQGERTIIDAYGQPQVINVALEPLSCDYRMKLKQAEKEELPRLASAIIGCSYDELMNRRRQYKMRRLTAIFTGVLAIAIGFGVYFYYSKQEINKNYRESLRNQSRYLANESKRKLDKEQRILALQLALSALPEDKNSDRPITAEAVRALTDASLAYITITGNNIEAVWNYRLPNSIADFMVSPDGKTLAARDTGNTFIIWDTTSHEKLVEISDPMTEICGMIYFDEYTILVWGKEKLTAMDTKTGEARWSYKADNKRNLTTDEAELTSDGCVLLVLSDKNLLKIDGKTGEVKGLYDLGTAIDDTNISPIDYTLSPDCTRIAFKAYINGLNNIVGVYEIATGNIWYSGEYDGRIRDIAWADDNRIMIAYSGKSSSSSMTISEMTFLNQDHTLIECLNAKTLIKNWSHDLVSTEVVLASEFMPILQDNQVAYFCGNIAEIYDLDNGTCYYSHNTNSSIIDISDRDGDGWPLYITTDGQLVNPYPSYGENAVSVLNEFTDNLDKVDISNGVYVHQDFSRDIIYYGLHVGDDEWQEIDENLVISELLHNFTLDDEVLAVMSDEEGVKTLTLVDPNENRVMWRIASDASHEFVANHKLLGASGGYYYLVQFKNLETVLTSVNLSTGEVSDSFLSDVSSLTDHIAELTDDKLVYVVNDPDNAFSVGMYDTKTGKTAIYPIGNEYKSYSTSPIYIKDAEIIYYPTERDDFLIDTNTKKTVNIESPYAWTGGKYCVYDDTEELIIATDESTIGAFDRKGSLKYYFTCPGTTPIGLFCLDGELLVPYSNGTLYRYKIADGSFISRCDLSTYIAAKNVAKFEYDKKNHLLYIQIGQLTDVIDTKSWYEITNLNYCLGHHGPTDHFMSYSYNSKTKFHLGYFKHYTVDELMEKGKKFLNGLEMTDEEKSEYGLEH